MSVAQWINRRQNEAVINDEKVRKNEVLLSFKHAKTFQDEIKPLSQGDKLFMYNFNNLYNEAYTGISYYLQEYDIYEQKMLNGDVGEADMSTIRGSESSSSSDDFNKELQNIGKFVLKYNKLANYLRQNLKNEPSSVINQVHLKMDELGELVGRVIDIDNFNDDINIPELRQLEDIKNDIFTRNYLFVGYKKGHSKFDVEQEDAESLPAGSVYSGAGFDSIHTAPSIPPFIFNWEKNDPYRRY